MILTFHQGWISLCFHNDPKIQENKSVKQIKFLLSGCCFMGTQIILSIENLSSLTYYYQLVVGIIWSLSHTDPIKWLSMYHVKCYRAQVHFVKYNILLILIVLITFIESGHTACKFFIFIVDTYITLPLSLVKTPRSILLKYPNHKC